MPAEALTNHGWPKTLLRHPAVQLDVHELHGTHAVHRLLPLHLRDENARVSTVHPSGRFELAVEELVELHDRGGRRHVHHDLVQGGGQGHLARLGLVVAL